jgi:hypothetical protein
VVEGRAINPPRLGNPNHSVWPAVSPSPTARALQNWAKCPCHFTLLNYLVHITQHHSPQRKDKAAEAGQVNGMREKTVQRGQDVTQSAQSGPCKHCETASQVPFLNSKFTVLAPALPVTQGRWGAVGCPFGQAVPSPKTEHGFSIVHNS